MEKNIEFINKTKEKIIAVLIFPLSYIYYSFWCEMDVVAKILFALFTVGFIAFAEIMYWNYKRTVESCIFLCLLIISSISFIFGIGSVWEEGTKILFTHLFAVYWVLVRSNRLAEGETSHLFVWDGIMGFMFIPFENYPLAIRTILGGLDREKKDVKRILGTAIGVVVGIILFITAMGFLKDSDANFDALMGLFDFRFEWKYFFRIFSSIFVALYIYGLLGGCYRTDRNIIDEHTKNINSFISKLKRIPALLWIMFIVLFSIFYVLFFVIQGSYMIDAFSMILPETYTFSEYARKGFGDMCAVMVINFALVWLTMRTSDKNSRVQKISVTVIVGESLIFAVIAFLKLLMYIEAYGFTPLRLQSVWLVLVLSYACVCILTSLYSNKKTARIWFVGSASALALLTLI